MGKSQIFTATDRSYFSLPCNSIMQIYVGNKAIKLHFNFFAQFAG